jgi:hypothetical protein
MRALAIALVLAVPAVAGAQDPRLAQRLPPDAVAPVTAVVDSARRGGLPTEPLVDRALEGASKRAGAERIVAAVRRLFADLGAARDALGVPSSEAEIVAGASALRAGARPGDLVELRRRRGRQPVTVAAAMLTDLVALGVPPDTATAAVLALADEADDATYVAFRRGVERDVALGATPLAALTFQLVTGAPADRGELTSAPRPRKP